MPLWSQIRRATGNALYLPAVAIVGILAGGLLWGYDPVWARWCWLAVLAGTGGVIVVQTVRGAFHGRWAADVVATLAIVTAVVMNQPLAGLIIVLMQAGGEALERFAEGRASEAVRDLEADRPQQAHVVRAERTIDVQADDVLVGDTVVIRPGELVPCDGIVVSGSSELDTSKLTGEPVPEAIEPGVIVRSGSLNGNRMFTMRATAIASESQYARIVELVRTAQESKAPFQRLADRYAVWFTPITLAIAVGAVVWSGDVNRLLAVLVVATPCPLILAPPIAIIGGINRAARQQIIVRNGAAIERLAHVDAAVLDKTGTLTIGKPTVQDVTPFPPYTRAQVLAFAGSVEQGASHLLARTVVDAALREHVPLTPVVSAVESPGRGVVGQVAEHTVAVGSRGFAREHAAHAQAVTALEQSVPKGLTAYVVVDNVLAGVITYADQLRAGAADVVKELRTLGIQHVMLLSGDHAPNVTATANAVGIDDARGDLTPEDKVTAIRQVANDGHDILMVGDGTNDAPALTAAAVGIALAGHGGGVTAEAADVVVLIDELARVPVIVRIARRTMRIARQSVWVGLGLSGIAMIFAAFGFIAPIAGALLQEGIDVAVILNALRASAMPSSLQRAHIDAVGSDDARRSRTRLLNSDIG
jgi:heavy metal translocating P-type ATPase